MKVLHIVAGDLTRGAARGAYWLHQALLELGVESKIWTNSRVTFGDKRVISILKTEKDKIFNLIRDYLDLNLQRFYPKRKRVIFSTGFWGVDFTKSNEYNEADIIHLHWINGGFVNIKHLKNITKPIVWTMRDTWPFTGGCHVAAAVNCTNYINGCGNCKQLNSGTKLDLSRYIFKRKQKYLPKHIKLVGISNWLTNEAKKSKMFKDFDVRTFFNNVNSKEFFPIDKKTAREILMIKTDKKIILAGAQSLKNFYKGFDKFIDAIIKFDKNKYLLCFFGDLDKSVADCLGYEYKNFGFLHDTLSLRLVYSAANVFVAPSIMDAFGKTLAESMACGTPVVCFDATGPKDIVSHKVDGYKARPFDTSDLANGIKWVLNYPEYDKLCENARKKVLENFDSKIVAQKYIQLYQEILNQ
jgi:glycosyltransferase involved in cell wall biosynthesis